MKMKKSLSVILSVIAILFASCSNWMKDDNFYGKIENDVKVANASNVSVYIRYANSKMGTTDPSGSTILKQDIPAEISAVTNDDYGFVRWVAFSTNDFPTGKQYSNLFYETAEKYEQSFKALELPANEVIFEDPYSPATKVTLETTRGDIFITPLVAKRPTVVTSVPSNGSSDIVRNTSIRILFSKKMDASSLVDEFGNSNIVITSGSAVLTENSDGGAKDVTENCTITLGKTGKMLTISPKTGFYFDNNSQITVSIYDDVRDSDGYGMNGKYSFSFTTGVKLDSLAPRIDTLWASVDEDFSEDHRFEQYKYILSTETVIPVYKTESDNATNKLSDFVTGDNALETAGKKQILKQRVKDYLNIYVQATDIAGSGGNVDTTKTEYLSESSVALIQVRACLYVDAEGKSVTTSALAFADDSTVSSDYYIPTKDIGYAPGLKDSECMINDNFETVFPSRAGGTLFTYDLRHLPDGLIKIDIWAVDMVGNSGETESYVKQEYNNNYRSIFVVKDSKAPDSATEKAKVITQSGKDDSNNTVAPYEWYNSSSLSKVTVKDQTGTENLIHDANNEYLRSDDTQLKWIFKVGNDPSWRPSPTDTGWTNIHNSSNLPEVRTLSEAVSSSDGPVDITMCLMDDLGNISAPALLKSINYDSTVPGVPSTVSWVQNTSTTSGTYDYKYIVSTTNVPDLSTSGHILKIPFTEVWAGLRRIKVTVQKDGTGGAVPQDSIAIRYIPQSGSGRNLDFASGSDSSYKIISVPNEETDKVTTGDLYISGLKIGDVNGGTYKVTVDLWDSSLNHSVTTSDISIDVTPPVIVKSYIPGLKHSISVTSSGIESTPADQWFLPHEYVKGPGVNSCTSVQAPCYIPLYLFVTETDSGIHKIIFDSSENSSDSVKLFADVVDGSHGKTTLYKIENYGQPNEVRTEVPSGEYTIDATNKTITLVDNPTVKLSSSSPNGFVILIDNIGFKDKTSGENTIKVTVEDLATQKHVEDQATQNTPVNNYKKALTVDLAAGTTVTGVYSDSYLSITPGATLSDRGSDTLHLAAVSGYTNEEKINLTVTLNADSASNSASSGYNKINISGASFINDGVNNTVVKVGNVPIPYELSSDKKTITFRNKNAQNNFTNDYIVIRSSDSITINNVLLDSKDDSTRSVSVKAYDLAGWESSVATKTIIFDNQSPALYKGPYTTFRDVAHKTKVYPHYKEGNEEENQTGIDFNGVKTFFTATGPWPDDLTTKGVALGFKATDNISLYGTITTNNDSFLLCYKHGAGDTTSNVNKAKVVASGSLVTSNKKDYIQSTWVPGGNKETESMFQICFGVGTYSAVIVDKAGNCSDVFHFTLVEDTTGPVVTDLQKRVLLQRPDNSSNIYRPENSVVANDIYDSSVSIRTKKYVTKKITSNYQIILNLGATYDASSLITKISGAAPESVDAYTELNATASSSPIEKYAIATNYSKWPKTADSTDKYVPSTPSDSDWKDLATSTDFTDDCAGIQSKVDGNKNLIIKLPNNSSIPIISVFLQDACGNSSYIVLGNETTSGKETAPCFIVDDRLGAAPTENGVVTEPICLQFPFMVVDGSHISWDGVGFDFVTQSGNAEAAAVQAGHDGVGSKFGFMKDKVKKATYYNPAITDSDPKRQVKLGLALHYDGVYGESVTFPVTETTKATKTEGEAGKYTLRGLLYCTQSSSRPTYNEIMTCLNAENQRDDSEKTGQVTDWTYLQEPITNEARILLDYPRPDYDKLGWTVNETNHEPKPYYMWYLLEDRVGNYELAKVVNSQVTHENCNILYGSATSSSVFDKWLYDGAGPVLAIRGTITDSDPDGTSPSEITNTPADVARLIATNNGYRPYLKPGTTEGTYSTTVFIHSAQGYSGDNRANLRDASLVNQNAPGFGTTHYTESWGTYPYSNNRMYENFVDLEVSELTGIRAFAWTQSATPLSYSWETRSTGVDTHGYNVWYGGYNLTADFSDIGCDHNYGGSTGDKTNTYFSFTENSSSYKGTYSGTKVNTVIPYELLASTAARNVYLHVMDWTGNISTYRIGQNLQFQNDIETPDVPASFAGHAEPNQYYLSKNSSEPILIRIAGKGTYALAHSDINVNIPGVGDSATWGSGIKGISFKGINEITNDEWASLNNGAYIKLDYNTYSAFSTTDSGASEITYYVYDNVGNVNYGTFKGVFDATPPELTDVKIDVGSGNLMYAAGDSSTTTSKTYSGEADFYDKATDIPANKLHTVYINKNSVASFTVTLPNTVNDLESIKVYQWDNSNQNPSKWKWVQKSTQSAEEGVYEYTINGSALSYTTSGTIFQILATDISGNTSCQYFKLYLDNVAPTFVVRPTVTITKGSINKDKTENIYYYSADSDNKMSVSFTIQDVNSGSGSNAVYGVGSNVASDKIPYWYRIGTGTWTAINSASVSLSFTNETVESIEIKDALGNTISTPAKLKYVYGSGQNEYVEIEKLQFYNTAISTASTYTAKAGWTNYYLENSATNLADGTGIRVLNRAYQSLQITFNKPDGIIGYVADTKSDAPGAYSMQTLSTVFTVDLPADKSDITKTYYAVDYIGQTRKIDVLMTYNNPYAAQNIEFLPSDSAEIPDTIKSALTLTTTVDNGNTRYYKNGWIVVRCTLKEKQTYTYQSVPNKVFLYDTNDIKDNTQPISTIYGTTSLKTYYSEESVGEGDNKRYYYYLAFQLSDSHKDKKLYCVIRCADNSDSDATALGNVTWKHDTQAPEITDQYVVTEDNINKLKGFVLTKSDNTVISSITKAKDSYKGKGYQSNIYPSGAIAYFKWRHSESNQYIKDNSGSIQKYKFVITQPEGTDSNQNFNATASASDNDWLDLELKPVSSDIFNNAYCYKFVLPDVTSPHCHLALFLMDKFGNVSAPYYLVDVNNNVKIQWWLTEQTLSNYTYTKSSDNKTYSIKLPLGTVVNNISVENAEIDTVSFADYNKGQPDLDKINEGWIILKDSSAVGLTVTLKNLVAGWSDKPVKLKINTVENTVHTITAKSFTKDNIQLGTGAMNGSNFEIPVTLTDGAPADKITSVSATPDSVEATWDGDNKKIILSNLPSASWTTSQDINLTINSWDMGKVHTINQLTLQENQFSLGTAVKNGSNYEIPVTLSDGVPASAITTVSATNSVTATWDGTNKKIILSTLPAASWNEAIEIGLTVNSYNKGTVVTIAKREIQPSDITVSDLTPATLGADTTSVTFKLVKANSSDDITIDSVSLSAGSGNVELSGPSSGVYTLTGKGEGGKIPTDVTVTLSVGTNHGSVSKPLYANGVVQQNRISATSAFAGLIDTSKLAGGRDLASIQITTMGRGIIMNKDFDVIYSLADTSIDETSSLTSAAKKVVTKAAKAAKSAAKAPKEAPVVQEIASQVEQIAELTELSDFAELTSIDQAAMILPNTANVEAVQSPVAEVSVIQPAPVIENPIQADELTTDSHSKTALWIVLCAFLAAAVSVVLMLRKRVQK